jgi:hypothetical protein
VSAIATGAVQAVPWLRIGATFASVAVFVSSLWLLVQHLEAYPGPVPGVALEIPVVALEDDRDQDQLDGVDAVLEEGDRS